MPRFQGKTLDVHRGAGPSHTECRTLLCGEAVEAGRDGRDGQAPTRAVTEELESFQMTGLANRRAEDGERKGRSRGRL